MALAFADLPLLVAQRRSEHCYDGYKGCVFSPDGYSLLTAEAKQVHVLALPTSTFEGEPQSDNWTAHTSVTAAETIYDYDWYPSLVATHGISTAFAYTCKEQPVKLVSADGANLASYAGHNHKDELDTAYSLCFTPDGCHLLAGYAHSIMQFDVSRPGRQCARWLTRSHRHARKGQKGIISALAVQRPGHGGQEGTGSGEGDSFPSPDVVAAGSYDGSSWLYDMRTGGGAVVKLKGGTGQGTGKRARKVEDGQAEAIGTSAEHPPASSTSLSPRRSTPHHAPPSGVTKIVWGAHGGHGGSRVYVGYRQSCAILAWDVRNASQPILSFPRDARTQQRIGFDVDYTGGLLMTGGRDGVVKVYDTGTGALVQALAAQEAGEGYDDCVNGVSLHPCGIVFATSTGQRRAVGQHPDGTVNGDDDDVCEDDKAKEEAKRSSLSHAGPHTGGGSRACISLWRTQKATATASASCEGTMDSTVGTVGVPRPTAAVG